MCNPCHKVAMSLLFSSINNIIGSFLVFPPCTTAIGATYDVILIIMVEQTDKKQLILGRPHKIIKWI